MDILAGRGRRVGWLKISSSSSSSMDEEVAAGRCCALRLGRFLVRTGLLSTGSFFLNYKGVFLHLIQNFVLQT
jgi:hypothetical protein